MQATDETSAGRALTHSVPVWALREGDNDLDASLVSLGPADELLGQLESLDVALSP